jgi:hypothetical protein
MHEKRGKKKGNSTERMKCVHKSMWGGREEGIDWQRRVAALQILRASRDVRGGRGEIATPFPELTRKKASIEF